jgi:hypothetical protein
MDDRKHAVSRLYFDRSPTCLVYVRSSPRDQISITVAVTLVVAVCVPLSAPALSSLLRRTQQFSSGSLLHCGGALLLGIWSNGSI